MERTAVRSRDLAIVGYDPVSETLEVAFKSGGVYHYSGVPAAVYQKFLTASSVGKYFSENIKDKFQTVKIH